MPEHAPLGTYLKFIQCQLWNSRNYPRGGRVDNYVGIIRVHLKYYNQHSSVKLSLNDVLNESEAYKEAYSKHVSD